MNLTAFPGKPVMPHVRLHLPVSQEISPLAYKPRASWGMLLLALRASPPGTPTSLRASHPCPTSSHLPCRTLGHTKGTSGAWELASSGGRGIPCCCNYLESPLVFVYKQVHTSAAPPLTMDSSSARHPLWETSNIGRGSYPLVIYLN